MNEPSINLSIWYLPSTKIDGVAAALQTKFNTLTVNCKDKLRSFLKSHQVFCNLICSHIREPEDLHKITDLCAQFPKLACVVYGRIDGPSFYLQLGKNGVEKVIPHGEVELLFVTLHELKEQAMFRIDLRDFEIDVTQCKNYWCRRFFDFVPRDFNFLRHLTVEKVASQLGTSVSNLVQALRRQCWLSPKQLLLCLRNYYAAYLLDTTHWSTKVIAKRCRFADEHQFYKSFRNKTGLTIKTFCNSASWRHYPALYLQNMKIGS